MKPVNGSSSYYSYKMSHSFISMTLADPDYQCLYVNLRANGRVNNGAVWNQCLLQGNFQKVSYARGWCKLAAGQMFRL